MDETEEWLIYRCGSPEELQRFLEIVGQLKCDVRVDARPGHWIVQIWPAGSSADELFTWIYLMADMSSEMRT